MVWGRACLAAYVGDKRMVAGMVRIAVLLYLLMSLLAALMLTLRPPAPRPLLTVVRVTEALSLWLRDVDHGYALRLLDDFYGLNYAWSPDSRWLAYESFIPALGWNAYVYRLADRSERFIASPLVSFNPSWSPDSRWLIIYNNSTLLYLPTDRLLTDRMQKLDVGVPEAIWSQDSAQLYYLDTLKILGVVDTVCLSEPPCVRSLVPVQQPIDRLVDWMPDGQRLMVFSRLAQGERYYDLYSLDPTSGDMNSVLVDILPGVKPAWTEDGMFLAASVVKTLDLRPLFGLVELPTLVLVDAASGAQRSVWRGIAGQLDWTPAGDRLVFEAAALDNQVRNVYVFNRLTDELTRLPPPGMIEMLPRWQVYPGRRFEGWMVLALDGLVIVSWLAAARSVALRRRAQTAFRRAGYADR